MKVCKFGGSSVANADQIRKVCEIVLSDEERRVVVVSAPGKRNPEDKKVTDLLIELAKSLVRGEEGQKELKAILDRFTSISRELRLDFDIVSEIKVDIQTRIESNRYNEARLFDSLKAAGEDNCAKLVAAYLNATGHKASYVNPLEVGLFLSDEPGKANVLEESYQNLRVLKEMDGILVFPGFFGFTKQGKVVTFDRGGSDITGSILAAALSASVYENWTDVDSVFVVNPNLVKNPASISEITYAEMRELAYAGFSVIHEEALAPAYNQKIKVNIRNTNNPYEPGTWIVPERRNFEGIITGIAGSKGFSTIYLSRYLMNKEVGFALRVLQILKDFNIPFEHMPSGMDSLSIIIKDQYLSPEIEDALLERMRMELKPDEIYLEHGLAMVMIVGDAMAHTVGVVSRASNALSRAGINLELINQGLSEISAMFGVKKQFLHLAIKELYKEFFAR